MPSTTLPELFLTSNSNRPPFRIGVLLDSFTVAACFARVLDDIQNSEFANLELLILNGNSPIWKSQVGPHSKLRTLLRVVSNKKQRSTLLYTIYQKLDAHSLRPEVDPLAPVDCTTRLSCVSTLNVTPLSKGFVDRFSAEDEAAVRSYDLDVILRFGFNILRGGILTSARYGIWSYHHDDNEYYRGGPAGFWELYERNPLSGVILQILREELDAGRVLTKACYATNPSLSLMRNRVTPFWGASSMVIEKLSELHSQGWGAVESRILPEAAYKGKRKLYRTPANSDMIRWLGHSAVRKARNGLERIKSGNLVWHWRIGIRRGNRRLAPDSESPDLSGFEWRMSPAGHFHADPFLIVVDGRTWLFFEDFSYSQGRGVIACKELLPEGNFGEAYTVIQRPYHLSYPFVFEHDGQVWMIPESAGNETVELYRADVFPYRWTLVKELFHGKALDTTMLFDQGLFWFFTTLRPECGDADSLVLFYSESIDGRWRLHPRSPISRDVRDARCAGRIRRKDGRLYRTCQNSMSQYGQGFGYKQIVTLTTSDYSERPAALILPWEPGQLCAHHTDSTPTAEVVDGMWRERVARHFVPSDFLPEMSVELLSAAR